MKFVFLNYYFIFVQFITIFTYFKTNKMNTNRLLLGTLTGFIGYFMAGYLFYVILFKDLLASTNPGMAGVQAEPNMVAIIIGNLVAAFLLSYIFERWAGIREMLTGAGAGAIIGLLMALSYDSMIHGTTTLMTWNGVLIDTLVYTLISAVAGALTAFGLSYKRA